MPEHRHRHRHRLLPWRRSYVLYAYERVCMDCGKRVLTAPEEAFFRFPLARRPVLRTPPQSVC